MTFDFETEDDFTTPLVNGQSIMSPDEFGNVFAITTEGVGHRGAAIFDSSPLGPNINNPDQDMLVDLGNILILQSGSSPPAVDDVFETPDDDPQGGTIAFTFVDPVIPGSIDIVDQDRDSTIVTLTDTQGATRTYTVPGGFSNDLFQSGPAGFDTLDLTTLAAQTGEGGGTATATELGDFNPFRVVEMRFETTDSIGLDNLVLIPEPGSLACLLLAGLLVGQTRLRPARFVRLAR